MKLLSSSFVYGIRNNKKDIELLAIIYESPTSLWKLIYFLDKYINNLSLSYMHM